MKIIKIVRDTRQKQRYILHFDNQESLSVHEDVLVKHGLSKGKQVDGEQLASLYADEERSMMKQISLRYLSIRPRTSHEMREYLHRKGFPPEPVEELINWLTVQQFLDDQRFAEEWVEVRLTKGLKGRYLLSQELRHKGIQTDVIERVINRIDHDEEFNACLQLAKKRLRLLRPKKKNEPLQYRLYTALSRRGFPHEVITAVLQQLVEQGKLAQQSEELLD